MSYNNSEIDKKNFAWFTSDIEAKSLVQIELTKGTLRGLHPFLMEIEYPISVIAGKNGSGKSTILAMACCAYHNGKKGYIPSDRNKNYYTFSDFFIQTADEVKVEGIEIWYQSINHWKSSDSKKLYDGLGKQVRYKNHGGKWNKYQTRAKRNVIFSGIQRIVPPGERKTERTYSGKFISVKLEEETKKKILEIAGRILGKKYSTLDLRTVNKRRLFVVDRDYAHYSGFNMGAGENAMFSLLIELFSAGRNTLLVIDEIELGLHEEAQRKLMEELKKICLELHCQIICSTHSASIIDSVPLEARFFVESYENRTEIYKGISSSYALGKLSGGKKKEINIYTEDEVGKAVVLGSLSQNLRERVNIIPIGSEQAVLRQLSACFREGKRNCMAFLDGDKRNDLKKEKRQVEKYLETRDLSKLDDWIKERLCYLPGKEWPEKYLVNLSKKYIVEDLVTLWKIDQEKLKNSFDEAIMAGKHNEFYTLSQRIVQDKAVVQSDIIRCLANKNIDDFNLITVSINKVLEQLE